MFAANHRSFSRTRSASVHADAVVREALGDHAWRLDDGRRARQALSCLVTPQTGDRVLLASTADGQL